MSLCILTNLILYFVTHFSGKYGDAVGLETLKDFHRSRVQILARSGADLFAFETIPNKLEAQVFAILFFYFLFLLLLASL